MDLKNFLETLKLPLKATVSGFLITVFLLTLNFCNLLDFGEYAQIAKPILIISSIVFAMVTLVSVIEWLLQPCNEARKQRSLKTRRKIRRDEAREQQDKYEAEVIKRLDYLSDKELAVLAKQLSEEAASFTDWFSSPTLGMLQQKGMIKGAAGSYHGDHFPFTIVDFVWEELLNRKDEFLLKHEERKQENEVSKRKGGRSFERLKGRE